MGSQSAAVVVMEACGSAHYWARELLTQGHEVKLIAPQYVRPFVKRQKNDAADAEAIVAAQRPEMRFVEPKTSDQQARAILFRARERIVHQRTELVNALRAVLYEYGHVVPLGIAHIKRIDAMVDDADIRMPDIVREECRDLLAQISEKTARIEDKARKIADLSRDSARAPIGPMPGIVWSRRATSKPLPRQWGASSAGGTLRPGSDSCPDSSRREARKGSAGCPKPVRSTSVGC